MTRCHPRRFLPALLLLAAAPTGRAQDRQAGLFFDTVDVAVVNIEVVVTDHDGQAVTGLTRDDFEILEDGKPVEISNFFAVEDRQVVPADETVLSEGESLPTPDTKRLNLVVFIDDLNTRPQNRNQIFHNLRSYLEERLDPRDRVLLVSMNETVKVEHPFTNDVPALLTTLDRLERQAGRSVILDSQQRMLFTQLQTATTPRPDPLDPNDFIFAVQRAERLGYEVEQLAEVRMQRVAATTQALAQFADSLAGMPGRKAILYVSDGLPVRPAESISQAWLNKFEPWAMREQADDLMDEIRNLTLMTSSSKYDATRHFDELVEHASADQVAFYPISNGSFLARGHVSAEYAGNGSTNGRGPLSPDVATAEVFSNEQSLLQLAGGTGGIAFTRTTNIGGLLGRMVEDFESFYSLGYQPPEGRGDGVHDVKVKVHRDGVEVRYLTKYREKDPLEHLQELTLSALHYGLVDNPLGVQLEPVESVPAEGGRFRTTVLVKVPFDKILLLPEEGLHSGRVTLFVVVEDEATGGVSKPQRVELPIQIPNERILEAMGQTAAYPLELEMKQGAKRIAVGVRDHLSRTDSTVQLELTVGAADGKNGKRG